MTSAVTRHFVTIDGRWGPRQVHYRRAGEGPAVLLLHQSPQSSIEMVELMHRWAPHFTLIAPDTPGYGQSDALGPAMVSIDELAAALAEFVDAIGLRRFGIYGYHTGSSIGLWLAAAHPARVTALAANGLASFDAAERSDILAHYLPAFTPSWDGSHLAWLWARVREQTIFFPWHERSAAARLAFDVPPAAQLQRGALEFMRAGDHYASAYRAAFESQPQALLPGLTTPLLVTATPGDPLRRHLQRFGAVPATVALTPADSAADAQDRCLAQLLARPGDAAPAAVATRPIAGRLWNTMLASTSGQVHARLSLTGSAEPVLLLHGAGGSALTVDRLAAGLVGQRPLILPDLPGHGESDPPETRSGPTLAECARAALATLAATGVSQAILAGAGTGAWVAVEAARRGGVRHPRLTLIDAPCPDAQLIADFRAEGMPSLEPVWYGGHLLLAWHLLRDGRLFFPWFQRRRAAALGGEPDLDPARLQLELREMLVAEGAWQNLGRDVLDYAADDALARLPAGAVLGAAPCSGWHSANSTLARAHPALTFVSVPPDPAHWLAPMLRT